MSLSKRLQHFGSDFRHKRLHAWQIGGLLAIYNLALIFVLLVLSLVSINSGLWAYFLLMAPFGFGAFWLWFSQVMLRYYTHLRIHDAVVIAKVGALPFMAVFLGGVLGLTAAAYGSEIPDWWTIGAYYTTLFGVGSIALELSMVVFGLRHKLPIRVA
jgi:hypothetical protein